MKTLTKLSHNATKAGLLALSFAPSLAHAADSSVGTCSDTNPGTSSDPLASGAQCGSSTSNATDLFGVNGIFNQAANVLIFLIGAVSVLVLIYGGFQYVTSTGDKGRVENAKNTILYAIIGIVVAILAYAIVSFVIGAFAPKGS